MAWTGLKENSCCCCWIWFLIGHFVFQTTVRLAARVRLCYLGSSCFGRCVFIILMWRWRACQSEAYPPPPGTVRRSPLCIFWNRFGTTCFAYLGRHLAAIGNKQTNTPQSYISCNCLRDTKQNLADKRRDAARELWKTNVCFGAKQNPENHFAPHARLSCKALFSRWDVTRGAYQAFKARCWQLKKLPSTTAAGRTAVWRMKRAFDFGFV